MARPRVHPDHLMYGPAVGGFHLAAQVGRERSALKIESTFYYELIICYSGGLQAAGGDQSSGGALPAGNPETLRSRASFRESSLL